MGYEYVVRWMSGSASSWMMMAYENLVPFTEIALPVLGGFAGTGIAFGAIGSLFFVGRYLKV